MKKIKHIFLGCVSFLCLHSAQAQVPNLDWVKGSGGSGGDAGNSIAVDAQGNVYSSGYFSGTVDFDPGAGVYSLTSAGNLDIFVQKMDPNGAFLWARSMGSTGPDYANGLALDASANVYITGNFSGTVDFDPGAGILNAVSKGGSDIFVQKLNSSGNLQWAKTSGGLGNESSNSIAINSNGVVYTVGEFNGTVDFDPTAGVKNLTSNGSNDVFLQLYNPLGVFLDARSIGGIGVDRGWEIKIGPLDELYIAGSFEQTADLDPSPTAVSNRYAAGGIDGYLLKLNPSLFFIWAKVIRGIQNEEISSIAVNGTNVYATGYFTGTTNFSLDGAVLEETSYGDMDAFLLKMDQSTGAFVNIVTMGGTGMDWGRAVSLDTKGQIYLAGIFTGSARLDPYHQTTFTTTNATSYCAYLQKFDPLKLNTIWIRQLEPTRISIGYEMTIDAKSNIYLTGSFMGSTDFDPAVTSVSSLSSVNTTTDLFVLKLKNGGANFLSPILLGNRQAPENLSDTEDNSTLYGFGNDMGYASDDIFYSFNLTSPGAVTVDHCNSVLTDTYLYLYDANQKLVASNDDNGPVCTGNKSSLKTNLAAGNYFIASEGYGAGQGSITTHLAIDACPASFPGSSIQTAIPVSFTGGCFVSKINNGACFSDHMGKISPEVYYKMTLSPAVDLNLSTCSSEMTDTYLYLLDANGVILYSKDDYGPSCPSSRRASMNIAALPAGTYYVAVEGYGSAGNVTGNIQLDAWLNASACAPAVMPRLAENTDVTKNDAAGSDNLAAASIHLYPNPTSDNAILTIDQFGEPTVITLSDSYGRVVYKVEANGTDTEINTAGLATGMYYLTFQLNGKTQSQKLQVIK